MKSITKRLIRLMFVVMAMMHFGQADACTNIAVGRKATKDGSVLATYCVDGFARSETLHYVPHATHTVGAMRKIYNWEDKNSYMGEIPEVAETWNVVGNTNEWQLTITETTCPGLNEMHDPTAIIDYGSLIYITLERAKTAREAIRTMTELVEKYGLFCQGETFTIADPDEMWLMFMNSCGSDRVKSPERNVWAVSAYLTTP